jgi:FAD/FMN-containing dehydrogenase
MGATTALGFDTSARAWAASGASATFRRLPALDGVVLTDPTSLASYSTDAGSAIHETPVAVLLPGSVRDIEKAVEFCARHHIKVAARGQGHSTFGQSLVDGGLVIDMGSLNRVHSITSAYADVGAGLKWNELVTQTAPLGLAPPALTGYLGLSIGGTLSVGGISSSSRAGAQVDNVIELDVVTGGGRLVTCSNRENRDLFEMALAGLGQCGIITRAKVRLEPVLPQVRVYTIDYENSGAFFSDLRELLRRGELDDFYNFGIPNAAGGWSYQLTLAKKFAPSAPPNDAFLLRGLSVPSSAATVQDVPFLAFALRVDQAIDFFRSVGLWDGVLHPWFDVFLPEHTVEPFVSSVVASLTPEDVGPTGFLLMFPQRRSRLTRPLLRVPDSCEWVFLFDILTAAPSPGADAAFQERMLDRNRRLFERARRLGGKRYPIGSVPFDTSDWVRHYGEVWPRLARLKRHFDPCGILTPGPGIFR